MKKDKYSLKRNKDFDLVVKHFGGLENTANVLKISYSYASHLGTGRRNISPSLCFKIKKATNGKFDFENITVLNKQ
jgi:DNA-binding transcriptional regulator YdaS (Cro superfamily)